MVKKHDTVVTSLRIPTEMAQVIKRDAQASGVSFNALIMKNLLRYTEWERFTEKIGFVCVPREMLRALIEGLDPNARDAIAAGLASSWKESILLWFKEVNLATFLEFFRIAATYSQLTAYDIRSNGTNYTITLHHQLGENWSRAYPHFAHAMFKSCLGVDPEVEAGKSHIVIRFSAPQP